MFFMFPYIILLRLSTFRYQLCIGSEPDNVSLACSRKLCLTNMTCQENYQNCIRQCLKEDLRNQTVACRLSLKPSQMRLSQLPWPGIVLLIVVVSMVLCGAPHCSWERGTDFRGLSRHRSVCKHFQKASTLATERRRDRARGSIQTLQKSSQLTTTSGTVPSVSL